MLPWLIIFIGSFLGIVIYSVLKYRTAPGTPALGLWRLSERLDPFWERLFGRVWMRLERVYRRAKSGEYVIIILRVSWHAIERALAAIKRYWERAHRFAHRKRNTYNKGSVSFFLRSVSEHKHRERAKRGQI